jgi:hypothetical protein
MIIKKAMSSGRAFLLKTFLPMPPLLSTPLFRTESARLFFFAEKSLGHFQG